MARNWKSRIWIIEGREKEDESPGRPERAGG